MNDLIAFLIGLGSGIILTIIAIILILRLASNEGKSKEYEEYAEEIKEKIERR